MVVFAIHRHEYRSGTTQKDGMGGRREGVSGKVAIILKEKSFSYNNELA